MLLPSSTMPERYHLFGFPIAHSASPTLHNHLFSSLGLSWTYGLTPMKRVGVRMRVLCRAENFGGASVTMPLKVSVIEMLDHVTEAASRIGAVNTIVPVRNAEGRVQIIGTNTDWLGVRNALLHALPSKVAPSGAALVIGGGGAARAAVYALASVNCAPVYLVGRDPDELTALVAQFPEIPCVPITNAAEAHNIVFAVACVPAIAPSTPGEYAADACTRAILEASPTSEIPRIFLDMCYKPRTTPLIRHAAHSGWKIVSGIEAMLEQGFAQSRMWLTKSVSPDHGAEIIPKDIEEGARRLLREMPDIIVKKGEERSPEDEDESVDSQLQYFTAKL